MCSIFGSFDKDVIKELLKLNQFRGNFSYSITQGDNTVKDFGPFNTDRLDEFNDEDYIICHVQSPTGGMIEDRDRIHPTEDVNSKLWHNGLLKANGIRYLQKDLDETITFDTKLLHKHLIKSNFTRLSEIEGLFACVFQYANEIFLFRTKHGKLYIDDDLSISSVRFTGLTKPPGNTSHSINYDTVYKLDLHAKRLSKALTEVGKFKTKKFNYVIHGEL